MNVNTILITREEAERKLDQYKSITAKKRVAEDDKLQSLYAAVSKGARVLNLAQAFKQTGLNEQQQPRLAIARADWKTVFCFRNPYTRNHSHSPHTVGFTDSNRWNMYASARNILLPANTFAFRMRQATYGSTYDVDWSILRSAVPHIPPACRPKNGLHNYHILFEVEKWEKEYPVDPFLMRQISGMLFVIEAEWELTPLEASLLSSMTQGN
ncbi:MAG: hypothetical protein AB1757_21370 [Acidobacteriota bacterium]